MADDFVVRGEPLLALDVIRAISHEVKALTEGNNGIAYSAEMTTNGYFLTRSVFREMLSLGVRQFQISLDGPRSLHDKKRVLANGKGTFTRVWHNLKGFRRIEGNFTILVRVHVAKDNYKHIGKLIRMYAKVFGKDKRFKLFLRPLSRLGCSQDATLPVLDEASGKSAVQKLARQARQLGIEPTTTADLIPICYAARLNSFAIRADGTINKCTVKLSHSENQVGRINANGSLRFDRNRLLEWARGLTSGDRSELACPLINISGRQNVPDRKG